MGTEPQSGRREHRLGPSAGLVRLTPRWEQAPTAISGRQGSGADSDQGPTGRCDAGSAIGRIGLLDWADAAVAGLLIHAEEINRLNVFPVADCDTGTNMVFTMRTALAQRAQQPVPAT